MADGCLASGMSAKVGEQLSAFSSLPPSAAVALLMLVVSSITAVTSNVATASIFLPVVAALARSMRLNPLFFMLPTGLSAGRTCPPCLRAAPHWPPCAVGRRGGSPPRPGAPPPQLGSVCLLSSPRCAHPQDEASSDCNLPGLTCSLAFVLPVSTPPNAIAFSTGRLRIADMVGVGLVLNALGILVLLGALHTSGAALFDLYELPAWSNATAPPGSER